MRKPNSQECIYFGRKLNNVVPDVEISKGWEICVGSDNDDEIYFPPVLKEGEEMLKERVKIYIQYDYEESDVSEGYAEIDLEDILRFAASNCRGIFDRVVRLELGIEILRKKLESGKVWKSIPVIKNPSILDETDN